jgi:hypothetical protein
MPDNSIVRLQAGQHGGLALLSATDSCVCMRHHATVRANVLANSQMARLQLVANGSQIASLTHFAAYLVYLGSSCYIPVIDFRPMIWPAAHNARLTDDAVPKLNLRFAHFARAITYGKRLLCHKAK